MRYPSKTIACLKNPLPHINTSKYQIDSISPPQVFLEPPFSHTTYSSHFPFLRTLDLGIRSAELEGLDYPILPTLTMRIHPSVLSLLFSLLLSSFLLFSTHLNPLFPQAPSMHPSPFTCTCTCTCTDWLWIIGI